MSYIVINMYSRFSLNIKNTVRHLIYFFNTILKIFKHNQLLDIRKKKKHFKNYKTYKMRLIISNKKNLII